MSIRRMKTVSEAGVEGEVIRDLSLPPEVAAEFDELRKQYTAYQEAQESQKASLEKLSGVAVFPVDGKNWILLKPKMKIRIAQYYAGLELEKLSEEEMNQPVYFERLVEMILPMMAHPRLNPDGTFVKATRDEILESFDFSDCFRALAMARGRDAQRLTEDAGGDPNA